jgi:hypothetical protein
VLDAGAEEDGLALQGATVASGGGAERGGNRLARYSRWRNAASSSSVMLFGAA